MKSDMEAIFEMVKQESEIQHTMDAAAQILSSGEYMNDQQEKKLIIDDQMPPLESGTSSISPDELLFVKLKQSIDAETKNVERTREARVLAQYALEIRELAEECNFEITEDLTKFNKLQLIQIIESLRNLHREQRK